MTTNLEHYTRQSNYSDPGEYADVLAALPPDIDAMTAVIRNVLVHYRTPGVELPADRLTEIDSRWVSAILGVDQQRFGTPLDVPREQAQRTAGCCRDYSLVSVAALRQRGIPARTRIGFGTYLEPGFNSDHVITEYWDGERWNWMDVQLDMPKVTKDQFLTAARVWTDYRNGKLDPELYGVGSDVSIPLDPTVSGVGAELPLRGAWFIRNYVVAEVAHRYGDELLLWDMWGVMSLELDGDLEFIDQVAALLLAADDGDESAERELSDLYRADHRLRPGSEVRSWSPAVGEHDVVIA